MKYYRRFAHDGSPFFVDENGNVVDESTAKVNLVESSGAHEISFTESVSFTGKFLRTDNGSSRKMATADQERARDRMDEAFRRFLPVWAQ